MKKSILFSLGLFFVLSGALLAQPSLTLTPTPNSCFSACDGSISAVGSGGAGGPYTYDWVGPSSYSVTGDMTGAASGLCAGKYYITVTDGSGSFNDSVIVTEPLQILADSITSTTATDGQANGTFQILISGGNGGPYTADWTPNPTTGDGTDNISGAAPGSYSVAISDGICSTTKTFVLRDSCTLKIDSLISTSEASLNSGTARVVASGGAGPYSYLWDNGDIVDKATGLARGSHSVTVTDVNMCSVSCSVNVMGGGILGMSKKFSNPPRIGKRAYLGDTITYTIKVWNTDNEIAKDIVVSDVLPLELKYDTSMATTTAQYDTLTNLWSIPVIDVASSNDTAVLVFKAILKTPATNITNTASATWNTVGSGAASCGSMAFVCNGSGAAASPLTASDSFDGVDKPIWNLSSAFMPVCMGACSMPVTVLDNGLGFMPYSYSWSDGALGNVHTVCGAMVSAPYSVTVSDAGGETAVLSYNLVVNPLPTATATPASDTICSGTSTSISLTADMPSTFAWTVTSTANITGASAGSGNSIADILTNTNNVTGTVTYAVTPTSTPEGCNGAPINVLINVDPTPTIIANPLIETINCGLSTNIVLTSNVPGTTINWNYTPNVDIAGANNGSGSNINDTLFNGTAVPSTLSYTINSTGPAPTLCPGAPVNPQVTVNPPFPVAGTVINNATCNGYTDGAAKAEPMGGVAPFNYSWSPSGITVNNVMGFNTVTGLAPGTHTVVVTDAVGVTSSASVIITEPPLMTFGVSTSTPVSCNGGTNGAGAVSVTSGGQFPLKYYWPAPAVKTSETNTGSTGNQMSAGSYLVTVSDAKGCSQVAPSITVTEPTAVAIDSVTSTIPFCVSGTNASATVYPKPGSGTPKLTPNGYTFLWNTVPSKTTKTVTGLKGGLTYQVSVFDSLGCMAKKTFTITQPNPINIAFSNMPVNCNGPSSGSSKAKASVGKSPYSFKWYNNFGNNIGACSATSDSCLKGNLSAGSYMVSVTDANGCTATSNTNVIIENKPVFALQNLTMANCGSPNGYASINVTADYPLSSNITWIPDPATLGGSVVNDTAIYAPGGTYKAVFTSPVTACKDTFTVSIPIYTSTKPIVKGPSPQKICYGDNYMFATPSSLLNYKWLLDGTEISGATDSIYYGTQAGNYQVITYNTCGSDTSLVTTLEIDSLPLVGVPVTSSGAAICPFGSVTLSAPSYSSYEWYKDGVSTGITTNSITVTNGGQYQILATSSLGCMGVSNPVNIIKVAKVESQISSMGALNLCVGQSATFYIKKVVPGNTYLWSTNSTDTIISVITPPVGGPVTYTCTVTDVYGCTKKSNPLPLTIHPYPVAKTIPTKDTTFCLGKSITITGKGGGTYKWSNGQTDTSFAISGPGKYWVTVTSPVQEGGCKSVSDTINIIMDPGPVIPVVSSRPLSMCYGDSVILSASGYSNYKWFNNPNLKDSSIVIKKDTTVFVTANQGGCILKSLSHKVTVHPRPAKPILSALGTILTSNYSGNNQWLKNGVVIPGATLQTYTVTQDGIYRIRVTNSYGCDSLSDEKAFKFTGIASVSKEDVLKIYPNPFEDKAKIQYELSSNSVVKLEVYNIIGERVALLADEKQFKGTHSYEFSNSKPGIYLVRLIIDGKMLTHKLTKN